MNRLESYLAELEDRLSLVSSGIRRDIIAEARDHLVESAVAQGGGPRGMERAIRDFGSASEVAARYREVYEPGAIHFLAFCSLAAALAALSHPFLGPASAGTFALVALALVYTSLLAGKRVGTAAAIAAVVARFGVHGLLYLRYADFVDHGALQLAAFLASTLLLIPLGFIPGRLKERTFGGIDQ
ncbi:MAG: hypothetical protein L0Z54_01455 [Thermoplasmata archaeon]|nr:hypothetical protein [Thermoplasmata archaeon]